MRDSHTLILPSLKGVSTVYPECKERITIFLPYVHNLSDKCGVQSVSQYTKSGPIYSSGMKFECYTGF